MAQKRSGRTTSVISGVSYLWTVKFYFIFLYLNITPSFTSMRKRLKVNMMEKFQVIQFSP